MGWGADVMGMLCCAEAILCCPCWALCSCFLSEGESRGCDRTGAVRVEEGAAVGEGGATQQDN